jgi:AhpD family alkylhydroperoxidase
MDEKTKELIAIGASVGAHCQPCLTHHVEAARELGVDEDSIRSAIETGQTVERGAMSAMKKFCAELQPAKTCSTGCSGPRQQSASCCG